ncbi:MAG: LacI family DNA-binding transcriptional regulator [Pseudomonadota bacterium]
MSTLKDVADKAQVSVSTVSRVINNEPLVKPKTREKVENAIAQLNYMPNRVAQRLRSINTKNKLLGLVLPDIQNPFYVDVVRGVEGFAYQRNFSVMIGNFDQDESKEKMFLEILQSESIDGLIVAPSHGRDQHIEKVIENGYPVVCIDRGLIGTDVDVVKVNNQAGAFAAIEYLIKLGHRKIAHITGHPQIPTTMERVAGYEQAMSKHGVAIDSALVKNSQSNYQSGADLMLELLRLPNPPTAVFTANNLLTLGALKTIHESGLRIPEDISIIGFDDMYWSMSLNPPLTAIRQSGQDIGRIATEILLQKITDPGRSTSSVVLDTELIVRRSCKALELVVG